MHLQCPSAPITTTRFRCKKKLPLKGPIFVYNDTNFRFSNGNSHYFSKFIVKLGFYLSIFFPCLTVDFCITIIVVKSLQRWVVGNHLSLSLKLFLRHQPYSSVQTLNDYNS